MINLKLLRNKCGFSQKELSNKLGITQQAISLYEADKRQADYDTLKMIAGFFSCTIDYLLGVTNEPNLVHYKTGYMYEGSEVIINIVEDAVKNGLTEKDIIEFIEMGKMWRKMQEKKDQ